MVIASHILIVVAHSGNIVSESPRVKTVPRVKVVWQRRGSDDPHGYRIQCVLVSNRKQIYGLYSWGAPSRRSRTDSGITEYPRPGLGRKHCAISGRRKIIPKAFIGKEEMGPVLSAPY